MKITTIYIARIQENSNEFEFIVDAGFGFHWC